MCSFCEGKQKSDETKGKKTEEVALDNTAARTALNTKLQVPGHLIDDPADSMNPTSISSRGGRLSMLTSWRRRNRGRTGRRSTTRRWGWRRIMGRSSVPGNSAESSQTALRASELPGGRGGDKDKGLTKSIRGNHLCRQRTLCFRER